MVFVPVRPVRTVPNANGTRGKCAVVRGQWESLFNFEIELPKFDIY